MNNGINALPGFVWSERYRRTTGTAIVIGENTIDGNMDAGILATRNSGVLVGDPNFDLPSTNTISNKWHYVCHIRSGAASSRP